MKLILNGCLGRMGRAVAALAADRGHEIVAGGGIVAGDAAFPIYTDWANLPAADAVIDFSSPAALAAELAYVTAHGLPLVLFFLGYYLGTLPGNFGGLGGCLGFVLGIVLVVLYDRKVAKKSNLGYTITAFAADALIQNMRKEGHDHG